MFAGMAHYVIEVKVDCGAALDFSIVGKCRRRERPVEWSRECGTRGVLKHKSLLENDTWTHGWGSVSRSVSQVSHNTPVIAVARFPVASAQARTVSVGQDLSTSYPQPRRVVDTAEITLRR